MDERPLYSPTISSTLEGPLLSANPPMESSVVLASHTENMHITCAVPKRVSWLLLPQHNSVYHNGGGTGHTVLLRTEHNSSKNQGRLQPER